MSYLVPVYNPRPAAGQLKNADQAMMRVQNPNVILQNGQQQQYAQQASGLYVPAGNAAVQRVNEDMRQRLQGLEQGMAAIASQLSPVSLQRITPELLAQQALAYQNFGFRPGLDNPIAPAIDAENGEIEGPVTLKTVPDSATTVGTSPTALSIEVALSEDDQTTTGGGRIISALGLALMPSGASANLPAGYTAESLKQALIDIGLVQVLIGSTIKAQYDAKDLTDTRFVQRVLEQPIRVQRGNYPAVKFRFVTVTPPPAAAASTYSLVPVFTSYWPPVR